MKVLVCGGRNYGQHSGEKDRLFSALDELHGSEPIDLIIYGCARGADTLARDWALSRCIAHLGVPADWAQGRGAGLARNHMMLVRGQPDLVVAFPGGRGTADMVRRAKLAVVRVLELE